MSPLRPAMLSRRHYLAAAVLTASVGLIWRLVPLGLDRFSLKYGGSILWAVMVYWLVAACRPQGVGPIGGAAVAMAVATLVEAVRLVHTPALDAFRLTLPGALLLGRIFSPWNLLAYAIGILLAASADLAISRSRRNRTSQ